MRVLFAVYPATAHLHPIVPLARALQGAGHEVRVAGLPESAGDIVAAGLTAVPVGERLAPIARGPERAPTDVLALDPAGDKPWESVRDRLAGMFGWLFPPGPPAPGGRSALADMVAFARAWRPDLVLWDPLLPAASIAARVCGAAHARLLWGQDTVGLVRDRELRLRRETGRTGPDALERWIGPLLADHGLPFAEEALVGQWSLDLTPPRLRLPLDVRYVPLRRVPYAGGAVLPDWLREPPRLPRVCLTLGVTTRTVYEDDHGVSVPDLLDAVAGLPVEVVATLGAGQLDPARPLPANVRTVDFLPLDLLLPSCAAVVHHGGGGTFAAAVAHRVPQLVVPVPKWDETVTARYVAERGAGLVADGPAASAAGVREALLRLLGEPSFRAGADALHRDMLATPGPHEIVPVLEALTAAHRAPGRPPVPLDFNIGSTLTVEPDSSLSTTQ